MKKTFELEPFSWEGGRVSRFLNIPKYGSGKKWAYAFNISVGDDEEVEPSNLISNPYESASLNRKKRPLEIETGEVVNQDRKISAIGEKSEIKKMRTILPTNCHFCFSNPNLEDHMIISIGKLVYLTTAKGPLSVPKGDMDMSGHCLIIPIEHIPKLNSSEKIELAQSLLAYQSSLVKMNYVKFDMSTAVFRDTV